MNNENNKHSGSEQTSSVDKKSLSQWLSYLESIHPSAIDMGLERVKDVANAMLLNLSESLVITVAGTNGC